MRDNDLSARSCMLRYNQHLMEQDRLEREKAASSDPVDKCVSINLSDNDNIVAALNRCVKKVRDAAFKAIQERLKEKGFSCRVDRRGETNWILKASKEGVSIDLTYRIMANNLVGMNYVVKNDRPRRRVERRFTSISSMIAKAEEINHGAEDRDNPEN